MPTIPYFLQLRVVLGSGLTGTVTYTVPRNETLTLRQIRYDSTGLFGVTDIRDSTGQAFTNASSANPIPSGVLQDGASGNRGIEEMIPELVLPGSGTLYIDLVDQSGASNTVLITLVGSREYP